jgi:hypothetical protein
VILYEEKLFFPRDTALLRSSGVSELTAARILISETSFENVPVEALP